MIDYEKIPQCLPMDFPNKKKIRAARAATKIRKEGHYIPELIDRTYWF